MTEKLFWADPYLSACDTIVTSVQDDLVTLRETVFYPFSGGQESDAGTIDIYPVLEAKKSGIDIHYRLPGQHHLKLGDQVHVKIDWQRRYQLMRLHFAAEVILELVYQSLPGIEKIGAHIAADKARLDFIWPVNISSEFPGISAAAQKLVDQNLEIVSAFSDEATQQRYWQVAGLGKVPCGGTHLRRTGEIGMIRLKRKNIGKGKERIEIYVNLFESSPDSMMHETS
ncbi:alanyl-tRNA editing protein [uncultured Desulfuromusa sp.]|uniref:alanyl-tRNA editing protein n=1 Tax=uncultured Desulfuromusa sp. TaxID=219183 RepID=UPI002AA6C5A3|nr:alanyl-tRNA editing protein [uncultured Desulfuromusa sp.]